MAAHWALEMQPTFNLTTAWNVNASYEHFWSPRWRTSIHGGYAEVKYGDQANAILCTASRRWCW